MELAAHWVRLYVEVNGNSVYYPQVKEDAFLSIHVDELGALSNYIART